MPPSDPKYAALERRLGELERLLREHYHNGVQGRKISVEDLLEYPNIGGGGGGGSVYGGYINTDGTGHSLPDGWSISGGIAGQCTVTHNLGTGDYVVVATVQATISVTMINVYNVTSTSFDIKTMNQVSSTTWTNTNTNIFFVLVAV